MNLAQMNPNKDEIPLGDVKAIRVTNDFVEVACSFEYHGNDDGYHRDATIFQAISYYM